MFGVSPDSSSCGWRTEWRGWSVDFGLSPFWRNSIFIGIWGEICFFSIISSCSPTLLWIRRHRETSGRTVMEKGFSAEELRARPRSPRPAPRSPARPEPLCSKPQPAGKPTAVSRPSSQSLSSQSTSKLGWGPPDTWQTGFWRSGTFPGAETDVCPLGLRFPEN